MKTPAFAILVTAFALLTAAFVWTFIFGVSQWMAGMLIGAGAIVIGVWLGTVVSRPPGLLMDKKDKDKGVVE